MNRNLNICDLNACNLSAKATNAFGINAHGNSPGSDTSGLMGANWGMMGWDLSGLERVRVGFDDVEIKAVVKKQAHADQQFAATCETKDSAPVARAHVAMARAHVAAMEPHRGPAAGKQDPGG